MPTFKCKMCGGEIIAENNLLYGICDSCGIKSPLSEAQAKAEREAREVREKAERKAQEAKEKAEQEALDAQKAERKRLEAIRYGPRRRVGVLVIVCVCIYPVIGLVEAFQNLGQVSWLEAAFTLYMPMVVAAILIGLAPAIFKLDKNSNVVLIFAICYLHSLLAVIIMFQHGFFTIWLNWLNQLPGFFEITPPRIIRALIPLTATICDWITGFFAVCVLAFIPITAGSILNFTLGNLTKD